MRIRPIQDSDIPSVAALLRTLSDEFIMHEFAPDAAANFACENDELGIRGFISAGMAYYVADNDDTITGFIAVRENKHVFHMFVDKAYHRRGIAKALWHTARRAALDNGNPGVFTVNASTFALPVYESLGFAPTAAIQCKNGIYYTPMQLDGRAA